MAEREITGTLENIEDRGIFSWFGLGSKKLTIRDGEIHSAYVLFQVNDEKLGGA